MHLHQSRPVLQTIACCGRGNDWVGHDLIVHQDDMTRHVQHIATVRANDQVTTLHLRFHDMCLECWFCCNQAGAATVGIAAES